MVFTSNRDDTIDRNATNFLKVENKRLHIYYPQDKLKKGTWLAFTNKGEVAILLNGYDSKHTKAPHHIESRGRIPIDFLISGKSLKSFAESSDFYPYEPFTLVVFRENIIQILGWNGEQHHIVDYPDSQLGLLLSSVTLYDSYQRDLRESIFKNYFKEHNLHPDSIFELLATPSCDLENGFFIDRGNVRTLSTSQIIIKDNEIHFKHLNHLTEKLTSSIIAIPYEKFPG